MKYSRFQIVVLIAVRLAIGYHFLYEGMSKLVDPAWSSGGFLFQANWFLSGFFHLIANSDLALAIVDFLNIYGQILIGLGLILGLFSSIAAYSGVVLLLFYYIVFPPFMAGAIFVDKNILEMLALLIVALFGTSEIIGLDRFIYLKKVK